MNDLSDVKEGDTVAYCSGHGFYEHPYKVVRTTKTQILLKFGESLVRFRRSNGRRCGKTSEFSPPYIEKWTEGHTKRYNERKILNYLEDIKWKKQPADLREKIYNFLNPLLERSK